MKYSKLIVDAHQDLAWNILTFDRDYSLSAADTRSRERKTKIPEWNGDTLLGWPEYQRGHVGVVFSTLFAAPIRSRLGEWDTQHYKNGDEAYTIYSDQLDTYYKLVDTHPDKFQLIFNKKDLTSVLSNCNAENPPQYPVGLVPLMEGGDAIRRPGDLSEWWNRGVRIIGLAWTGTKYCGGTREPGPLTKEGHDLLMGMAEMGFTLDISHMDIKAVLQSLDEYPGRIIASHTNAKTLLPNSDSNRFITDRELRGLIERDGIVGVVPFNRFLKSNWVQSDGREKISLGLVANQIDYICQIAGSTDHVGIGSDFDGGFGLQKTPIEIDTIADLQKLIPFLIEKGYTETDVEAVMGQNWIRFLMESLPEG
jgi:membrane dipeptidase